MAKVHIDGNDLVVEVEGLDKLWALKSTLTIPLAHVRGATADPGITAERKGIKVGGSRVPGVIAAGTFRQDGELIFWDVHDASKVLVIELHDESYARLVIQVDDPRKTADVIATAIA